MAEFQETNGNGTKNYYFYYVGGHYHDVVELLPEDISLVEDDGRVEITPSGQSKLPGFSIIWTTEEEAKACAKRNIEQDIAELQDSLAKI